MSVIPFTPSSTQVVALLQLESELRATLTNACGPSKTISALLTYFDVFIHVIHLAKAVLEAPELAHCRDVRNKITTALTSFHDILLRVQIRTQSLKARLAARLAKNEWSRDLGSRRWVKLVADVLCGIEAMTIRRQLVHELLVDPKHFSRVEGRSESIVKHYKKFFEAENRGRKLAMEGGSRWGPMLEDATSDPGDPEEDAPPVASDEQVSKAVNSLQPRYLPFYERLMLRCSAPGVLPVVLAMAERSGECHIVDPGDLAPSGWVAGAVIQVDTFYNTQPLEVQLISAGHVAAGASGAVYKGRSLYGLVALKVFHGVLDRKRQKLLTRELRNTKNLRHESILPFIGTAVYEQRTIIVSPFMRSGDMLHYLLCYRHTQRLELIIQVAQAVQYLHSEVRLAHGDLKCENVLISDQGTALLADFGLSTFIDSCDANLSTSSNDQLQNTLAFAAPELLFGDVDQTPPNEPAPSQPKSRESDVYAFGMLILQAFTTKPPWHGYNAGQILGLVFKGTPHPRPARDALMAELSDYLWELCRSCWARKPADRPTISETLLKLWSEQSTRHGQLTHDGVEQSLVLRDYRDVMPVP